MTNSKYYAVKKGRKTGIFETWKECQEQISGFKGASYKSFKSLDEAKEFLKESKEPIDTSLLAYVDGSYNKETQTSGFGLAFVEDGKITYTDKRAFPGHPYNVHRNVFGEIRGSEEAIRVAIAKQYKSICLVYDYQGIESWATGEWKANNKLTQEYQENIKTFSNYIKIYFKKVKAHASVSEGGDDMNDFVDKLAKESVGV